MSDQTYPPVALQLYTLRDYSDNFEELISTVAEVGYRAVETVHNHGLSAKEMQSILETHEVEIISAHVPYSVLKEDLDGVIQFCQGVGNSHIVVPSPPAAVRRSPDPEPWRAFARFLTQIGRRCRDEEIRLGYHNHAWEMKTLKGRRVIDWLMAETNADDLFLEPDLAWIEDGDEDAAELLRQYSGRCVRVHVKDLAPEGENEDQMGLADVGAGRLDWDTLLPAAARAGAEWFIVEHDKPKDPTNSIQASFEFLMSKADLLS